MNLKIGDKVKFLNDIGTGVVISFVDSRTANVRTDDWDVPVLISELIKINDQAQQSPDSYEPSETKGKDKESTKHAPLPAAIVQPVQSDYVKPLDDIEILYAFVPKNTKESASAGPMDTYLINDSNYHIYYTLFVDADAGLLQVRQHGLLEANTKMFLQTVKPDEIQEFSTRVLQCILFKNAIFEAKEPIFSEIKINPIKFFKDSSYTENDFFDKDAFLVSVYKEDPLEQAVMSLDAKELEQALKQKNKGLLKVDKALLHKQKMQQQEIERIVDLHIHELVENEAGLQPAEMLEIQLSRFRSEMSDAILHHIRRIVFIHGVGNGVLRQKLRHELEKQYRKYPFQDASFREYGYGATLVYLAK